MAVKPNRTFVHGEFSWPGRKKPTLPPPPGWVEIALEILREFSTTELVGKLYVRGIGGDWALLSQYALADYEWYKWYSRMKRGVYFDMRGTGRWEVIHFRNESDETGPYVAVALKYSSPAKGMPFVAPPG